MRCAETEFGRGKQNRIMGEKTDKGEQIRRGNNQKERNKGEAC